MKKETNNKAPQQTRKIGVLSVNPKGFGFLTTDDGEEFFVPPAQTRTALPGDRLSFTVEAGNKPGQFQAGRLELCERRNSLWLGTVALVDGYWRLEPDEACFVKLNLVNVDFIVPGTVVAVRVPSKGAVALTDSLPVTLERILGERQRKGFDVDYALAKFDFKPGFSPAALTQAARLPAEIEAIELMRSDRRDLRDLPFVTIDGEYTHDFDDAVYAKATATGMDVMVAIADVSHYVKPGSALDRDARARATSVYLPGKTVPMLPEALSNGLCSLNPGADRLAVVVRIDLASDGSVRSFELFRAVIQSKARLTYRQVTEVLEQGGPLAASAAVANNLQSLHQVYKVLDVLRKARGVIEFDEAEPKLVIREDGEFALAWEHRTMSHKLVEELMLLANRCVAQQLFKLYGAGLFRHQPLPTAEDWAELQEWGAARNLAVPVEPSLNAMGSLVGQATDAEQASIIEMRARQVMQQALYDTQAMSHFSLAFDSYTHFTSPIRRYADLLVHRLVLGQLSVDDSVREVAALCSERSRSARFAERQVWDRLKKRLLARDVAKATALDAKVVRMTRRGARVVIDAWQCAAFIPAENLLEEGFNFDSDAQCWKKNDKVVEPGVKLQVQWTHLEEERGRTELQAEVA